MKDGDDAESAALRSEAISDQDALERASKRQGLRRGLLAAIALLYVISVPWYRDAEAPLQVWFGLPDWVAVALGCYVAVAVLNAIAWRLTDISDTQLRVEGTDERSSDGSDVEAAGSSNRGVS